MIPNGISANDHVCYGMLKELPQEFLLRLSENCECFHALQIGNPIISPLKRPVAQDKPQDCAP